MADARPENTVARRIQAGKQGTMSDSLRDQLLKAGLVSEEQVRKAQSSAARKAKAKRRVPKAKRGKPKAPTAADRARAEKTARDRQLNAEREASRARNALNAQLAQIAEGARLNDPKADIVHNFVKGTKVKRVHVTPDQRDQLAASKLGITVIHNRVHLIDAATVEKLRKLDKDVYVWIASEQDTDDDGDYADHPIPDDLTW